MGRLVRRGRKIMTAKDAKKIRKARKEKRVPKVFFASLAVTFANFAVSSLLRT
jgi:hypothetical protein